MISDKRIANNFLLLVLFSVFVSGDAQVRCIEKEREALVSFKNGLIDDFNFLFSWRGDECCEWHGVECSNTTRHVITLQLRFKLRGKIGPPLLELHHLNHLDLSGNDFGGIPIPEFICSMKQLQHLYLSNSNFYGIVPPQIGNLTDLRSLDLSSNSLRGENLDWLSSLSLLSYLDLSQIDLSHTNSLHQLRSLQFLHELQLVENRLNGSMPDLRALSLLTEVNLSGNNFTGPIPLSIGQLSKLEVLDLSSNYLEGLVSESHFTKLEKLQTLDLSFNSLILDISPDWSPPFQLKRVYLAGCRVGPTYPKWIQTQRNLSVLDLRVAGITDEAPRWLWSTSSLLQYLYLSDNQIGGTIPNLSSTSILYMDLRFNQFSGPIPLFPSNALDVQLGGNMLLGSLSSICKTYHDQLVYLDLSNNKLSGEVPNCWEKMPNLKSLNLANNSFSGEIPRSFDNLHNLVALQMHGNNFSGELPYNLRQCRKLRFIDVGGNKLTGVIPTWIGEMNKMQFLNLRGNNLHGSIPLEICNLTNIQVLDLSINSLSSMIPDCFDSYTVLASKQDTYIDPSLFGPIYICTKNENEHYGYSSFQWKGQEAEYYRNLGLLKLIDFSSNGLTGNIPKSFSAMRGLRSLNLSINRLTGNIISDIGKMEMLDSLDLSQNQLSGKIPATLAKIYALGVLDLSNNNLSGKIPTSQCIGLCWK